MFLAENVPGADEISEMNGACDLRLNRKKIYILIL